MTISNFLNKFRECEDNETVNVFAVVLLVILFLTQFFILFHTVAKNIGINILSGI